MRRNILLTGLPGIGKSTVCFSVVQELRKAVDTAVRGFYTVEVRDGCGDRIGFDLIDFAREDIYPQPLARLSQLSPKGWHRVGKRGKYSVDVSEFQKFALGSLHDVPKGSVCVLDEIGKMELLCPKFIHLVHAILDDPEIIVLGTIPSAQIHSIPEVEAIRSRADTVVHKVTQSNRDAMPKQVVEEVVRAMHVHQGARRFPEAAAGSAPSPAVAKKMKLAEKYAHEPERISFHAFELDFQGDHGIYRVTKQHGGPVQCSCPFFRDNGTCSHVMTLAKRGIIM